MLSKHDELQLMDLKVQPIWLLILYVVLGMFAVGLGVTRLGLSAESLLCVGGGFLIALGAEKLVTRRIRSAAASAVAHS